MTYRRQRRPGPVSAVFWLFIALCALIALAEVYPPVTAPLAVLLVVAIVWGAIRGAKAKQRAAVARSRPRSWHITERRRGLKCANCGAPQGAGEYCQFCATPFLTTASERIVTER